MDELLKRFDDAKTLSDIYIIARSLKSEGVDALTVNNLVTQAKKKLVAQSSGVNRINKIPINLEDFPTTPITQLYINIQAINRPVITIHNNGEIVL